MPLVSLEPCIHPESLLTASAPDASACWWVLHTRPRTEKTLARKLLSREIGFYLPLYEHRLPAAGRVRT